MGKVLSKFFKNYANFKGRASRGEYWLFYLSMILIPFVIGALSAIAMYLEADPDITVAVTFAAMGLFSLIMFIPSLAVTCRRLHDSGKSGSYIFFSLIPAIGGILIFVWLIQDGEPCENRYGPDPKGRGIPERSAASAPQEPARVAMQQPQPVVAAPQPTVQKPRPAAPQQPLTATQPVQVNQHVRMNQTDFSQIRCVCEKGIVAGTGVSGRRIVIGRDRGACQMAFPENAKGISKRHCAVYLEGEQPVLIDLGSTYGTYLANGKKIPANVPIKIRYGDCFYLASGDTMIRVGRS